MRKSAAPAAWHADGGGEDIADGDGFPGTAPPRPAPADALPLVYYEPERQGPGRSVVKLGNKRIGVVRRRGDLWDVVQPAMPWSSGFTSRSAAGAALVRRCEQQRRARR